MANSKPVFGLASMGFGVLLIWSAYSKQHLFGQGGLIRMFLATGKINAFSPGSVGGKGAAAGAKKFAEGVSTPPNDPPPGSPKYLDA